MEASIFLAKLLGLYLIIIGVGVLVNLKTYQKITQDFFKNSALIYLSGVLALFFGLLVVLFHNVWAFNWFLIITILGWLGIVKGTCLIIAPNMMAKMSETWSKKYAVLVVHLVIVIALGIILTIVGYSA